MPRYGPIVLRPFHRGDLELVAEFAADPYVPLIGTIPTPYTPAEGLAYLDRQHQRLADGTGWSFAIAELATDRAVGGAGLWLHDDASATAGYAVAASARGRGIATAALTALTNSPGPGPTCTGSSCSSSRRIWPRSRWPSAAATAATS